MSTALRRRLLGAGCLLAGLFLVVSEVAWRTSTAVPQLPRIPPVLGNALVFLIGLLGLALIYAGLRLLRGR